MDLYTEVIPLTGIIVGVGSFVLAVFSFFKNREIRKIEIISEDVIPILPESDEHENFRNESDKINYQNDLYVSLIQLKNEGNKDLEFPKESGINIEFKNTKIKDVKIDQSDCYWKMANENQEINNRIEVYSRLLKVGEGITVKVFTEGKPTGIEYGETRIPHTEFGKKVETILDVRKIRMAQTISVAIFLLFGLYSLDFYQHQLSKLKAKQVKFYCDVSVKNEETGEMERKMIVENHSNEEFVVRIHYSSRNSHNKKNALFIPINHHDPLVVPGGVVNQWNLPPEVDSKTQLKIIIYSNGKPIYEIKEPIKTFVYKPTP